MAPGEFELIGRYFDRRGAAPGVRLGIGDDAAVLEPPAGRALVAALDTLVEGVHFPAGFAPADIGWRALAVNLSDLAAMGAEPLWALLGLTLPRAEPDWLEGFAEGFFELAGAHGVTLVGGDTTRGPLTVTVQLIGAVEPGRALRRAGARPGDLVCVSGTLGDAAAGLAALSQPAPSRRAAAQRLIERFRRPAPRVALGRALRGLASAAIDVSDGFAADLGHLCQASGVGASVDLSRLPLSDALSALHPGERAWPHALGGGDDYELLFTLPPEHAGALPELGAALGVSLSRVGEVEREPGLRLRGREGRPYVLEHAGYRHF